jgi:nucleoid-associated protein YgaU
MSAGTKVTIAVVVLFAALLGVYYGFGGPGSGAVPDELPPADEDRAELAPIDGSLPPSPAADVASQPPGVLAASVEQAIGDGPNTAPQGFGVLASDGGMAPVAPGAKPPDDPWVIGPRPSFPAPAAAPASEPAARHVEYTVREGDSMWTIADHWLGDPSRWGLIADANPAIDPQRLRVGQRLRIPTGEPAAGPLLNAPARLPAGDTPKPAAGSKAATFYTVRSGDTLSRIAQSHYRDSTKWRSIYDANRTTIGWDPDRLEVGMRLRIPPA